MNSYMRALASLKLTVGLLIVIAIVLSWATIVEYGEAPWLDSGKKGGSQVHPREGRILGAG